MVLIRRQMPAQGVRDSTSWGYCLAFQLCVPQTPAVGPLGSLLHLLNSDSFFLSPCKPQPRIHPKASAELLASASFNAHLSSVPSMVASFQHLVSTMLCFFG